MRRNRYILLLLLSVTLAGCDSWLKRLSPPPPGYDIPVYRLLLTNEDFPEGWEASFDLPEYVKAPATNHIANEWLSKTGDGLVMQSIWRCYSVSEAESDFSEKMISGYGYRPKRTLSPNKKYLEFAPPLAVNIRSQVADEFYLSCGILDDQYCITLARYRNYVVYLNTELKGSIGENTQASGLTYQEIEKLIQSMDNRFLQFLSSFP